MRITRSFPHAVREIEHCWVPMPDGARLAARLWLPADAGAVPAVLEYIPYRKRDLMRGRDETVHAWFAGHGYAAVRVDVRGSGDSDGVLADEYTDGEREDALAVIAWIAAQPWCDGGVGMLGKSWGGISALQVAARNPPALRAVIAVCATDDRFADDAHFMGGCLLNENLTWGTTLMGIAALPPDPAIVGDGWRAAWRQRLEALEPFPALWMRHPRRDDYWQRGSAARELKRITCPVYAIGGWADAYASAVPRLVAGLGGPRKGLIGPWAHVYPYAGRPGPPMHFLGEALRWWDQWLKGIETGITAEPVLRVWMQEGAPPAQPDALRAGRWVAETEWPSPRIEVQRWALGRGRLATDAPPPEQLEHVDDGVVGLAAGDWCDFGGPAEAPGDQREDDRRSFAFDTPALAKRLEILGAPLVTLEVAVDRPAAQLAVRLCDVAPDGTSTRVSYGLVDLRQGGAPLEPGRRLRVRMRLRDAAHAFAAGHHVRVAVSTGYWPIAWPSPEPVTLSIFTEASRLELPVRPKRDEDAMLLPFPPPETAPPPEVVELGAAHSTRIIDDRATGDTWYRVESEGGIVGRGGPCRIVATGVEVASTLLREYRQRRGEPSSATAEVVHRTALRREGFDVRVEVQARLTATADAYRFEAAVRAEDGGEDFATRLFDVLVPRD